MSRLQELMAELCPDGVEYKALGDVLVRTTNIKWAEHRDEEYQYIDLTSVSRIGHCIESTETIDAQSAPSRAQQIVSAGDILFGATRPTLMRYCEVPQEYDGQIASTGYAVFRLNTSIVIPRFVMHCLGTNEFMAHLEAYQKGSAYPAISMRDLKKHRIPVPPIEVQREVVRILDEYTAAHDELVTQLEEEMLFAIDRYSRCYDLFFEGLGPTTTSRLIDVCELISDCPHSTAPDEGEGFPLIRTPNIGRGNLILDGVHRVSKEVYVNRTTRVIPKANDLILAREGSAGNVAIIPPDIDVCLGQRTVLIRPDSRKVYPQFLCLLMNAGFQRDSLLDRAAGSTVLHVNMGDIRNLCVSLPSRERQVEASRELSQLVDLQDEYIESIEAEIALWAKQLALVRNQLLSFPEKVA